jgi:hypothetical protein
MFARLLAVGALTTTLTVSTVGLAPASQANHAGWANPLRLSPVGRSALQREVDAVLRARPGGTQTSQYEVSWLGGDVVLALRAPGTGQVSPSIPGQRVGAFSPNGTSDSCPWSFTARYSCFYSDVGFGGRRLQFADTYCSGAVNFGDWAFSNTISSWVNNSPHTVKVYDGPNTTGALLWKEHGVSHDANVGSAANDRADSATIC